MHSTSESTIRSREEDSALQRSTKKVKESYRDRDSPKQPSSDRGGDGGPYKEKLIGLNHGAFEHALTFENNMDTEVELDADEEDLPPGEVVVKPSGARKARIRATWNNVLIVKVFGKMVGYHYLVASLTSL